MSDWTRRLRGVGLTLISLVVGLQVLGANTGTAGWSVWALAEPGPAGTPRAAPPTATSRPAATATTAPPTATRAPTTAPTATREPTRAAPPTSAPSATAAPVGAAPATATPLARVTMAATATATATAAGTRTGTAGPTASVTPTASPRSTPKPARLPSTSDLRGVSLAGGEANPNHLPGSYGRDYAYPTGTELDYYKNKGFKLVRLPVRWERIQHSLYGSLDNDELERLDRVVASAESRRLRVILDLHNEGRYDGRALGGGDLPSAAFADLWRRLARHYVNEDAIWAYGLMHEPSLSRGRWPTVAQAAIDAIRAVDSGHTLLVSGEGDSRAARWLRDSDDLAVVDPANNYLFEAHQYFDDDGSGRYERSYDAEHAYPDVGVDRLKPFVRWLKDHNVRGFVGELGVPDDDRRWLTVLDRTLRYLDDNDLGWAYWAGGAWSSSDPSSIEPRRGQDRPQLSVLMPGAYVAPTATATATRTAQPSPTASLTATPSPTAVRTATVTLTSVPTPTPTPRTSPVAAGPVTFERRLSGAQVSEHRVPSRGVIKVEIDVTASGDLHQAVLTDVFPSDWSLIDHGEGELHRDGQQLGLSWSLGDLPAGSSLKRVYTLSSPALIKSGGPARDVALAGVRAAAPRSAASSDPSLAGQFVAAIDSSSGRWDSGAYSVQVASGEAVDPPLHAADVVVGSTTYNTVNPTALGASVQTATAPLSVRRVDARFTDASGISIWASDPVPAGKQWLLGNPWTLDIYVKASASNNARVLFAGEIYRINVAGQATLLRKTGYSSQVEPLPNATYQRMTWNDSGVPATTLSAGERLGVALLAYVDSNEQSGLQAQLGFDNTTTPSSVTWAATEQTGPGNGNVAHFRIGNDTPTNSPTWRAALDTGAGPVLAGEKLRAHFQVFNSGGTAFSWQPRLEWASNGAGPWTTVPVGSGSGPFLVVASTQFAEGSPDADITAPLLGTRAETWQNGFAYDASNPPAVAWGLGANGYTEVQFNVQVTANASAGTQYFLRISANGTALASYAATASVTTQSAEGPGAPPAGPTPTPRAPAHNLNLPYGPDTAACAACHRTHTAPGREALRKAWPEEQACYTCHDGTIAPNVKSEFQKTSHMPIEQTSFVHRTGEARTGASFSGANRHVECEDCHNPHEAGAGLHTLGTAYAAGPQQGVWGVSASWSSWWTLPSYSVTNRITYQYELCLKCHSSWAYGGSPPSSPSGGFPETDQSLEFNPYNSSYHPVAAIGKNTFTLANGTSYAGSLLNGLTPNSNITCSDCHGSDSASEPKGPHGSSNPFILRGTWSRSTGAGSSNAVCFTCHDVNVYANRSNVDSPWNQRTGFSGNGKNLHAVMVGARNKDNGDAPIVCMDCHIAVPHGWKRKRLIGFSGDGAPYINRPYSGGLTTIDTWSASGTWTFDSCGTAMSSCK